jgi:hypothetical protein
MSTTPAAVRLSGRLARTVERRRLKSPLQVVVEGANFPPHPLCYTHSVSWSERRYSAWLLAHEESLRKRLDRATRQTMLGGVLIGLGEALLPWQDFTPLIPPGIHIAVAALCLPALYMVYQSDLKRKQQAFTLAMADRGRRMLFLDPFLEPEEFALAERMHGAHLLPLARQIDTVFKTGATTSLHNRVDYYFRALPSPVHEADRMGLLSLLHPSNFALWGLAIVLCWITLPTIGLNIAGNDGFSLLALLLPLYLLAARANTRFAFEEALYSWLRLG